MCSIYHHLQEFAQRLCQQCQLSHQVHLRDDKSTCVTPHLVRTFKHLNFVTLASHNVEPDLFPKFHLTKM